MSAPGGPHCNASVTRAHAAAWRAALERLANSRYVLSGPTLAAAPWRVKPLVADVLRSLAAAARARREAAANSTPSEWLQLHHTALHEQLGALRALTAVHSGLPSSSHDSAVNLAALRREAATLEAAAAANPATLPGDTWSLAARVWGSYMPPASSSMTSLAVDAALAADLIEAVGRDEAPRAVLVQVYAYAMTLVDAVFAAAPYPAPPSSSAAKQSEEKKLLWDMEPAEVLAVVRAMFRLTAACVDYDAPRREKHRLAMTALRASSVYCGIRNSPVGRRRTAAGVVEPSPPDAALHEAFEDIPLTLRPYLLSALPPSDRWREALVRPARVALRAAVDAKSNDSAWGRVWFAAFSNDFDRNALLAADADIAALHAVLVPNTTTAHSTSPVARGRDVSTPPETTAADEPGDGGPTQATGPGAAGDIVPSNTVVAVKATVEQLRPDPDAEPGAELALLRFAAAVVARRLLRGSTGFGLGAVTAYGRVEALRVASSRPPSMREWSVASVQRSWRAVLREPANVDAERNLLRALVRVSMAARADVATAVALWSRQIQRDTAAAATASGDASVKIPSLAPVIADLEAEMRQRAGGRALSWVGVPAEHHTEPDGALAARAMTFLGAVRDTSRWMLGMRLAELLFCRADTARGTVEAYHRTLPPKVMRTMPPDAAVYLQRAVEMRVARLAALEGAVAVAATNADTAGDGSDTVASSTSDTAIVPIVSWSRGLALLRDVAGTSGRISPQLLEQTLALSVGAGEWQVALRVAADAIDGENGAGAVSPWTGAAVGHLAKAVRAGRHWWAALDVLDCMRRAGTVDAEALRDLGATARDARRWEEALHIVALAPAAARVAAGTSDDPNKFDSLRRTAYVAALLSRNAAVWRRCCQLLPLLPTPLPAARTGDSGVAETPLLSEPVTAPTIGEMSAFAQNVAHYNTPGLAMALARLAALRPSRGMMSTPRTFAHAGMWKQMARAAISEGRWDRVLGDLDVCLEAMVNRGLALPPAQEILDMLWTVARAGGDASASARIWARCVAGNAYTVLLAACLAHGLVRTVLLPLIDLLAPPLHGREARMHAESATAGGRRVASPAMCRFLAYASIGDAASALDVAAVWWQGRTLVLPGRGELTHAVAEALVLLLETGAAAPPSPRDVWAQVASSATHEVSDHSSVLRPQHSAAAGPRTLLFALDGPRELGETWWVARVGAAGSQRRTSDNRRIRLLPPQDMATADVEPAIFLWTAPEVHELEAAGRFTQIIYSTEECRGASTHPSAHRASLPDVVVIAKDGGTPATSTFRAAASAAFGATPFDGSSQVDLGATGDAGKRSHNLALRTVLDTDTGGLLIATRGDAPAPRGLRVTICAIVEPLVDTEGEEQMELLRRPLASCNFAARYNMRVVRDLGPAPPASTVLASVAAKPMTEASTTSTSSEAAVGLPDAADPFSAAEHRSEVDEDVPTAATAPAAPWQRRRFLVEFVDLRAASAQASGAYGHVDRRAVAVDVRAALAMEGWRVAGDTTTLTAAETLVRARADRDTRRAEARHAARAAPPDAGGGDEGRRPKAFQRAKRAAEDEGLFATPAHGIAMYVRRMAFEEPRASSAAGNQLTPAAVVVAPVAEAPDLGPAIRSEPAAMEVTAAAAKSALGQRGNWEGVPVVPLAATRAALMQAGDVWAAIASAPEPSSTPTSTANASAAGESAWAAPRTVTVEMPLPPAFHHSSVAWPFRSMAEHIVGGVSEAFLDGDGDDGALAIDLDAPDRTESGSSHTQQQGTVPEEPQPGSRRSGGEGSTLRVIRGDEETRDNWGDAFSYDADFGPNADSSDTPPSDLI